MKTNEYFQKSIILLFLISISGSTYSQRKWVDCSLREAKNGTYVIAHRGAHTGIPENSLPAYQKAIDLGCDFVEIDIRTTKDGKFVSIHNSSVNEYVKGIKGKVSELTLQELRSLDIGINRGSAWKNTKIPTFEEILDLCHDKIGIYLDLKAAPVSQLVDKIKEKGMEKEIVWYIPASDINNINELKTSCPSCILMPDPGAEENIKTVVRKFNVCLIATDMGKLSNKFVDTAHSCNTMVIADEKKGNEAEWRQMLEWKTDGIQTDRPEELISLLKSQNR